jgi:hypothetical protein
MDRSQYVIARSSSQLVMRMVPCTHSVNSTTCAALPTLPTGSTRPYIHLTTYQPQHFTRTPQFENVGGFPVRLVPSTKAPGSGLSEKYSISPPIAALHQSTRRSSHSTLPRLQLPPLFSVILPFFFFFLPRSWILRVPECQDRWM